MVVPSKATAINVHQFHYEFPACVRGNSLRDIDFFVLNPFRVL